MNTRADLESLADSLQREVIDLRAENAALRAERDRLVAEVAELKDKFRRVRFDRDGLYYQ